MRSWYSERNMDIYNKRKGGATLSKLATEYGLSKERIRQIFKRLQRVLDGVEIQRERERGRLPPELNDLDLPFYDWVSKLMFFSANGKTTYIRTLNCFYRSAILPNFKDREYYKITVRDALPILFEVDPTQAIKWRGMGVKSFDTFFNMVKEVRKIADEKGWTY